MGPGADGTQMVTPMQGGQVPPPPPPPPP
eukprot:SAG11_NODE_9671_length_890_cov_2.977244_2_plen_28_part_01